MHTDDLTVGEQQTTRYMCSIFGTLVKITKNSSKMRMKEKASRVWVRYFVYILIHNILLFNIKLAFRFTFFFKLKGMP